METMDTARELLIDYLSRQEDKIERFLEGYLGLADALPEEEQWRLHQMMPPPTECFTSGDVAHPVEYLEEMLRLTAFLKQAITALSVDQLAAFYLGLGFPLHARFWGFPQAERNIERVRETMDMFDSLMGEKLPESEHWHVQKSVASPFLFIGADVVDPRQYLAYHLRLLQAQMTAFAEL